MNFEGMCLQIKMNICVYVNVGIHVCIYMCEYTAELCPLSEPGGQ